MELVELKKKFCESRKTKMNDKEFILLLITFPAFRVVNMNEYSEKNKRKLMNKFLFDFMNGVYGDDFNNTEYETKIQKYINHFVWLSKNKAWYQKMIYESRRLAADSSIVEHSMRELMGKRLQNCVVLPEDIKPKNKIKITNKKIPELDFSNFFVLEGDNPSGRNN